MSSYLPPTTNVLDPKQRARLIRSTRKLGQVLGITPLLVEHPISDTASPLGTTKDSTGKELKRHGLIFVHPPGLPPVTTIAAASQTSLHTPPSSSLVSPPQNIPLDVEGTESLLVTSSGLSTSHKPNLNHKPLSLYLHLKSLFVTPADTRSAPLSPLSRASLSCVPTSPPPSLASKPDIGEIRRRQMAKLTRHLGEIIPPELLTAGSSCSRPLVTSSSRAARRRSHSLNQTFKEAPIMHASKSSGSHVLQTDQDWVGEWNLPNIRDVQKELRSLKVR